MLVTINVSRELRKKLTVTVITVLIPIAYWPGGELLQKTLSPKLYFLWVVLGIPTILVLVFGVNAYMNVQDDAKLEESQRDADRKTTKADGGGEV